jgi:hypothetical protein
MNRTLVADEIFDLAGYIRSRHSEVLLTDALHVATDVVLTDISMSCPDAPEEEAPSPFGTFNDEPED